MDFFRKKKPKKGTEKNGTTGEKRPKEDVDENNLEEVAMYDAFKKFDVNGDGVIDKEELKTLLTEHLKLKEPPNDKQISRIMSKVDINNDGVISFSEFKLMMGARENDKNKYLEIFRQFDKNKDGYITKDELANAMKEVHDDVTDEEIDSMMHSLDKSKCCVVGGFI